MREEIENGARSPIASAATRARQQFIVSTLCLASACTADDDNPIHRRSAAVGEASQPTGSHNCNLSGDEVLLVSLQSEGPYSRFVRANDEIALRVFNDLAVPGTLTIVAVVVAPDSPDTRFEVHYPTTGEASEVSVSLPLSEIVLPAHTLEVSRQLRIHGEFRSASGVPYEGGTRLRLYFHPQDDGWQLYDETIRDRDYSGGALTIAERTKRDLAVASLPPGLTAEYVDVRVEKLSDDPEYIPPDDALEQAEAP